VKRPLLDYFGSKWRLASHIIPHFPEHKTYVEVFCGAASILFKKEPSRNEIINDIHNEIQNLFYCLRTDALRLENMLALTPYSRTEYKLAREPVVEPFEKARRTIIKSWFGIGDSLDNATGFRVSLTQKGSVTAPWVIYKKQLHEYAKRLEQVIIECLDYRELIRRYDKPDTLFYLDPPYVTETRNKLNAYLHEWNNNDHRELVETLNKINGKFVLSGYENKIYEPLKARKIVIKSRTQKSSSEEVLWINE
jgi:DNA adenine methylase